MKKTIVIADDYLSIRQIVQKAVEAKGYTTLLAENGQEALSYFDGRTIDLLITDLEMPLLNGPELIKSIRNMEAYEFLPVIILSASPANGKENIISELNIGKWIQKPFDVREFYKIIEKYLERPKH